MNKRWYLICILVLVFLLQGRFVFGVAPAPAIDKTLRIEINKTDTAHITAARVTILDLPPQDYKVTFANNFYNLQILGPSDEVFFSGQISNKILVAPPDPLKPKAVHGSMVEGKYPMMVLNFPDYADAKKVRILDENNKLLLEINLALYGIPDTGVNYGECDSCGFCKSGKPPEDWEKCRACLYPSANTDPQSGDTIRLESGEQVKPKPGQAYTGLGCVSSAGFTTENGRSSATRTVLNFITGITGGLAFVFLLYGAFLILTAKGDAQQIQRGRKIILRTVIGAIIVFFAVFLVDFIGAKVLKIPGMG